MSIIAACQEPCDGGIPIRIWVTSNKFPATLSHSVKVHGIQSVWALEKQMVPCFIRFPTEETTLCLTLLSSTLPCREHISLIASHVMKANLGTHCANYISLLHVTFCFLFLTNYVSHNVEHRFDPAYLVEKFYG